jgi:hypothetical protein
MDAVERSAAAGADILMLLAAMGGEVNTLPKPEAGTAETQLLSPETGFSRML